MNNPIFVYRIQGEFPCSHKCLIWVDVSLLFTLWDVDCANLNNRKLLTFGSVENSQHSTMPGESMKTGTTYVLPARTHRFGSSGTWPVAIWSTVSIGIASVLEQQQILNQPHFPAVFRWMISVSFNPASTGNFVNSLPKVMLLLIRDNNHLRQQQNSNLNFNKPKWQCTKSVI